MRISPRRSITTEERIAAAVKGRIIEREPLYDFYIVVPSSAGIDTPIQIAWTRLGARSSSDLPKPFELLRIETEVLVGDKRGGIR